MKVNENCIAFKDGIHDISNDDYHGSAGISRSALMHLNKSPLHYYANYLSDNKPASEETPALVFGNLVHTAVLEPDELLARYVVEPKIDKRTKAGKEAYAAFMEESAGKVSVSQDFFDAAANIAFSISQNELAANLLYGAQIEKSIYFTHESTGLQCKVRPDAWSDSIIIDLKTTADASYKAFQSSAMKYGYMLQAGMINCALESVGIEMQKFVFIATEKVYPFAHAVYVLDDAAIAHGVNQFHALMQRYDYCLQNNEWEGYPVQSLSLPGWVKFEDAE